MPMGIVVISCVRPSVQPSMGLGLCIAYKALGRNGLQFGMLMYPDGLHSACMDAYGYCCWSVCPSICLFVRLRHFQVAVHLQRRGVVIIGRWLLPSLVDTGDICCHYWQHILVLIPPNILPLYLWCYFYPVLEDPRQEQTWSRGDQHHRCERWWPTQPRWSH